MVVKLFLDQTKPVGIYLLVIIRVPNKTEKR